MRVVKFQRINRKGRTSIQVYENTKMGLMLLKRYSQETFDEIIRRILDYIKEQDPDALPGWESGFEYIK